MNQNDFEVFLLARPLLGFSSKFQPPVSSVENCGTPRLSASEPSSAEFSGAIAFPKNGTEGM